MDEEFGVNLSKKFIENKKLFCKEVKKERWGVGLLKTANYCILSMIIYLISS